MLVCTLLNLLLKFLQKLFWPINQMYNIKNTCDNLPQFDIYGEKKPTLC